MSKNFFSDYLACILVRIVGPIIRALPLRLALLFGRIMGILFYYFDARHKAIVYANIKTAFKDKFSIPMINKITRDFYITFGQNIIEIFLIPKIDEKYIEKYVTFEGRPNLGEAFKKGKGVILLSAHAGSWEISNIIATKIGFPFNLFVRDQQRFPKLDGLLNEYRQEKGCKLVQRGHQLRRLVEIMRGNEAVGMTIDQGGKTGELVKFFGKDASMSTGALKLALKYDCVILPIYFTRIRGPYGKIIIGSPFEIKRTGDPQKDLTDNLQELVGIFEKNIEKYPKDYLWIYKVWKYTKEKNILVLTDGKTGHMHQAQAMAKLTGDYLKSQDAKVNITTLEVKFKSDLSKLKLILGSCLSGKYCCQGCLWCLKNFLDEDVYHGLVGIKPDVVISCGSSIAPINYIISRENLAKSIVIMRPSILNMRRFDLVVMSRHDHPPKRKNIAAIEGVLNLIDEEYLEQCVSHIAPGISRESDKPLYIGLLIGGTSKGFSLSGHTITEVIRQVKVAAEKINAGILVTTSRRTSKEVEEVVRKELKGYSRCKLLVIANEKNIPEAVGGILGLSQIVITSPESMSMISEAVASKKFVLVFDSVGLSRRHEHLLSYFEDNRYIHFVEKEELAVGIEHIWLHKPIIHATKDNLLVSLALRKIL